MIDYYELLEDDTLPVRYEVELDLIDTAPQEERPWLLWLFIKAENVTDPLYQAFRDDVIRTLQSSVDAVYAGSIAKEGWIEHYFYAPTSKRFENMTTEVLSRHGSYAYERGSYKDTKWELYRERLYPDGYGIITIQNRHTIESLEEAGDDLTIARDVEHYLFFQTKSAMERCFAALAPHGFELKENVQDDQSDYTYGAVLIKNEPVTPDIIAETTAVLYDAAIQEHGIYEGWSTVLG